MLEVFIKTLSDRLAITVFLLSAVLLIVARLLPASSPLGIWVNAHIVLVYLFGLGSLLYLPSRHILRSIDGHLTNRTGRKNLLRELNSLGNDDKAILYNLIAQRRIAFQTGMRDYHIAKSLEKRGVVFETTNFNFSIDRTAFDYLVAHPELLGIPTKK